MGSDEVVTKTQNLTEFAGKISGNEGMPLDHFFDGPAINIPINYELGGKIGDISGLRQDVQDIIKTIQTVETNAEKATLAHGFTNQYIQAESQGRSINATAPERSVTFSDLAKEDNPRGDCDDYSLFNMGLLLHGGVPP